MTHDQGTLLVVDDNQMNIDMLSRRLEKRGYIVRSAYDGQTALDLISQKRFDVVLLDIMMPGIDGLEVLGRLRETHTVVELPVIMATAKDQSSDVIKALELGANDYVTKPLDIAVVVARIETQLRLKRLADLKDEFLRIASHDLKNPLTVMQGSINILKILLPVDDSRLAPEVHELLDSLGRSTLAMQRLIEEFLDFQAMEDGQLRLSMVPTSLNVLVEEAVASMTDYARSKQIVLTLELDPRLPLVRADSARILQVVQNFVGNAIKFGFAGSRTVIRTSVNSGHARLEVVDAGPGLAATDMAQLFTKYARLSNKPTGTEKSSGLGLAICKQMIELHNGHIGARNNTGVGATFWFSLPLE